MKKVSKMIVRDQAEMLTEQEMKLILGGGMFYCKCGNTPMLMVSGDNMESVNIMMLEYCKNYDGFLGCSYSPSSNK